jgi:hypothetical protein
MGKMFQNASSLKPLGQLKPNCPGMIIGRSSTKFLFFYADRKFKMATTAGHRLTLDPMGKILYGPQKLRSIKYFFGDGPVHILPYDPQCHELFAIYTRGGIILILHFLL